MMMWPQFPCICSNAMNCSNMAKDFMLRVRISKQEHEEWAVAAGGKPLSEWVRSVCRAAVLLGFREVRIGLKPRIDRESTGVGVEEKAVGLAAPEIQVVAKKEVVGPPAIAKRGVREDGLARQPIIKKPFGTIPISPLAAVFGRLASTNETDLSKRQEKGAKK